MIFRCRDYPVGDEADWHPALSIRIANPVKHSPPSRPFEALIDTGASRCIFHASIGEAIGLKLTNGVEEKTVGVDGQPVSIYLHRVSIYVLDGIETITAGFCSQLPVAALLGRRGFLDRFRFAYDPSTNPPQFELNRVSRV